MKSTESSLQKPPETTATKWGSVVVDDAPEQERDEFVHAVWCLIYNMIEAGDNGYDDSPGGRKWWGEEFWTVKRMLEQRGFNCDPSKEAD